ncbi:MAG: hypothetical protein AAGF90_18665 [Pseudomonadota bacterium]
MSLSLPFFVVGSAAFYTLAMVAMKLFGQGSHQALIAIVIAGSILLGTLMEVEALKVERLGMIYVAILGAECVLIALASWALFGESFSGREVAGAGLIVAGVALAWA